jgi:hypothetical protein
MLLNPLKQQEEEEGLPSCTFPSVFPTEILKAFMFSLLHAIYPANLTLLDLIIQYWVKSAFRGQLPKSYRFLNRTTINFSRLTVHWRYMLIAA